jgi:DNA-binding MarR family transcriptional regulator/ribosomal protein S18 acetylase RimI-like enzyme
MDPALIARVRRFNRMVTQRIGALDDRYLARDRPLGEARLLWEIDGGRDVRALRARLDLDSGYLSRLLRALERSGLVRVAPSAADRRVRTASLTAAGAAERAVLDRRSDALAASLLEPLAAPERLRLVAAMAEIEKLLTAALVEIAPRDPSHPDAEHCLRAYFAELDRRFDGGFDPARSLLDPGELRPPGGLFLVATLRSEPVGCGGLWFHGRRPPEIKRMWVADAARGLGIGRRLLAELEARAAATGGRRVRLETNRALVEAIAMYRRAGYVEVPPYNDEPYAHHWFEKQLTAPAQRGRSGARRGTARPGAAPAP